MKKTFNIKVTESELNLVMAALSRTASDEVNRTGSYELNEFDKCWYSIDAQTHYSEIK